MDQNQQNQIDPTIQKRLNQPIARPAGLSPEDLAFLNDVVAKVEGGQIKPLAPSSLINHAVYDGLTPEEQGKVDFDAVNLLTTIRNIYDLWKYSNQQPTFQIENLVHQARLTKERFEEIEGDVYII